MNNNEEKNLNEEETFLEESSFESAENTNESLDNQLETDGNVNIESEYDKDYLEYAAIPDFPEDETTLLEETENVLTEETNVQKSGFKILMEGFIERLSIISGVFYTGIVMLISLLGIIVFGSLKQNYTEDISMANSCLLLEIFFVIVFIVFIVAFISSIVLNIKRRKSEKK